jgi:hypothetical protein
MRGHASTARQGEDPMSAWTARTVICAVTLTVLGAVSMFTVLAGYPGYSGGESKSPVVTTRTTGATAAHSAEDRYKRDAQSNETLVLVMDSPWEGP